MRSCFIATFLLLWIAVANGKFLPKSASSSCDMCGMRPEEVILHWEYPTEVHTVTTKDGFKLNMVRIPYGTRDSGLLTDKIRPVVYLMHGLLDSASTFLSQLPDQSLPFILADAGYDVWLGSNRGTTWSEPCDTAQCWDFSFDEYIEYDVPAFIDYALEKSGASSLTYIGHSQGTLQGFGAFSTNDELQKKVNLFVALAPVAFVYNLDALLVKATAELDLDQLILKFGFKQFLPSDAFIHDVAKACDVAIIQEVCQSVLFQITGKNPTLGHNLNMSRFEFVMWNFPAGTSVKNIAHWGQIVRVDRFGMYDYGHDGNLKRYNQSTPPDYNLKNIKVPVATFTGGYDPLADPDDAEKLEAILSDTGVLVLAHKEESYDHVDFLIGLDAHERIYPIVLDLLTKYNPKSSDV